jgi:hypothetical protein
MLMRISMTVLGVVVFAGAAGAADPPARTATGQSQMSVGFTPPEKKADGPKPWTREDVYRLRRHQSGKDGNCLVVSRIVC